MASHAVTSVTGIIGGRDGGGFGSFPGGARALNAPSVARTDRRRYWKQLRRQDSHEHQGVVGAKG